MDDTLEIKVAANESLFREANEGIERGLWPEEEARPTRFRCECAQLECNQAVLLTVPEYERVRENPRRFFVLDGHQRPGSEVVVERHDGYLVVEKIAAAGRAAERLDPRT